MMEMPSTRRRNQKYLILDTESVWDPYLKEAYASIDKKNDHPRIGCRKLIAISLWAIEFDVLGRLSTEQLQTWLTTNGQTEADILARAFQSMRKYPDHVLVGHGSIAHDCQIMMLAAMSADLELPRYGLEIMDRTSGSFSVLEGDHLWLPRDGAKARAEVARRRPHPRVLPRPHRGRARARPLHRLLGAHGALPPPLEQGAPRRRDTSIARGFGATPDT